MNITKIYMLVDPNTGEPRYIGKASNLIERLQSHIQESNKEDHKTKKQAWIYSLLQKGLKPSIEEIDYVPESEWQFWERHYISLYRSWGFKLTNMTEGGDGIFDKGQTYEQLFGINKACIIKNKISLSAKKRGIPDEIKKRQIFSRKNNGNPWISEETKKKISISNTGNIPWNKEKTWKEYFGEEKAKKLSIKRSLLTKGKLNIGRFKNHIWIYNNNLNKSKHIVKNDVQKYLDLGWKLGRFARGRQIFITKDLTNKRIYKEELIKYLELGWILGRIKK